MKKNYNLLTLFMMLLLATSCTDGIEQLEVLSDLSPSTSSMRLSTFLAYDELSVAYNTRVLRAKSIEGPYYGKDGRDCTNKGGEAYPILTHPYWNQW